MTITQSGGGIKLKEADLEAMRTSLDPITRYVERKYPGASAPVQCHVSPVKGRILIAKEPKSVGEIVFIESPLHIVVEETEHFMYETMKKMFQTANFDYKPFWYWCALRSLPRSENCWKQPDTSDSPSERGRNTEVEGLDADTFECINTLYTPSMDQPSSSVIRLIKGLKANVKPELFEHLLQVWVHNCFEHEEDPLSYAVYFLPSFFSHSCQPNAVWHYGENNNFVIRARRPIEIGEELTLSYLSEASLFEPSIYRKFCLLRTKGFVCSCPRCYGSTDLCRGFKCPLCRSGNIFLGTRDETSSSFDFPIPNSDEQQTECDAQKCVCPVCGYCVKEEQLTAMRKQELHWMRQLSALANEEDEHGETDQMEGDELPPGILVSLCSRSKPESLVSSGIEDDSCSIDEPLYRLTEMDVEDLHNEVATIFGQHWIHARWLCMLHEYHKRRTKDYNTAIQAQRLAMNIRRNMFKGESGSNAWTLEDLANTLLKKVGLLGETDVLVADAPFAVYDSSEVQEAIAILTETKRSMILLFGDQHEYYCRVNTRLDAIKQGRSHSEGQTIEAMDA